jgi:hypothetical protein
MLLEHMDKKFKTNPHYASRSSDATTKKKNLELHQVRICASLGPAGVVQLVEQLTKCPKFEGLHPEAVL